MTMADPPGWTHLLLESGRLETLQTPLRGSARLKFTCLSVSTRFIALGSNTGNVYIFDRNTQKHLQVVFPEVDPAAVNVVALCPNEKLVAFSTLNGHVIVMEMNVDKRARPERLKLITEHMRTTVTCIQWEHSGGKIYVADATGKVSTSVVPKVKNLVVMPADVIMRLESSVIQMDWSDNKLLVSTMTRAYLCNTIRQQYSQIGKKPREGEYGACFYKLSKTSLPMMYCARPSSRVWEVDYEGNVLSTHQFKHLLAIPPIKVIDINEKEWATTPAAEWAGQGINLPRLKMFGSQYLVSWRNNRVYVLNPVKVKVILWTELETGIKDMCTVKSDMYLFLTSGEVQRIQMFSVSQVVSILQKKNVMLAADLCHKFQQVLLKGKWRRHLSVERLQNIQQQIKGTDLEQVYNNFMVEVLKKENIDDSYDEDSSESNRSRSSSSASVQSYSRVLNTVNMPSTEDAILDCVDTVSDGDSHKEFSATEFPPNGESFGQACKDHSDAPNECHSGTDNTQEQDVSGEISVEEHSGPHSQKLESNEVIVGKNIINIEDEIGEGILDSSHDLEPGCDLENDGERNGKTSLETPSALLHVDGNNADGNHVDGNHDDNSATIRTGDEVDNILPIKSQEILQNDEDLAPVLALTPTLEVSSNVGRGKKKKRVKTVNLGVTSKGNKTRQKGTKSGGSIKRSSSTSVIEGMSNDTGSLTKSLSLDIYEDDIFSEETVHLGISPSQEKNVENKANLSEVNSEKSRSSLGGIMAEGCDPVSGTSLKPPNNGTRTNDRKNDGMMKVKSESDIAANLLSAHSAPHRNNGHRPSSVLNGSCDGKTAEFSNSYERKSAEFMSSTDKKDLTSSFDSSSLGSSPSQSPLSQSWEGPTGGSHTSTSPKVSLISMKDSLQSKFTVTKRRLLKTIKEKTLLTKSPSHEDLSTMNVLSKSLSGEDLLMMDSVPDKTKSGFGSIAEGSHEQERRPEPPVDLSDLLAKTESTLKMLQDTAMLLNRDAVLETLRGWVVQLNITLHELHTQLYNNRLRTDINTSGRVQDKDENNFRDFEG
ncbi:uncharacterized protein LOC117335777 [Pecten maximus]|uniref:uncharacterized protein LOC117335777 n=1 Tax=Pecten maximus TaxID=6579 RepID=UPI001457E66A|nr:uncharacterized protein LOC117335777 [Pecten maximus]